MKLALVQKYGYQMSHFNEFANQWDTPEKIERNQKYAQSIYLALNGKKYSNILELGCGTGLLGSHFISENTNLIGVDTSEGMLKVFNEKFKNNKNVQSINLNLEEKILDINQKFDLIISSMAFHHLKNPEEVVIKLKALLNQDGVLAIIDLYEEPGNFHPDPKNMGVYHYGFAIQTLESWGSTAGFKQTKVSTIDVIIKNSSEFPIFLATFFN